MRKKLFLFFTTFLSINFLLMLDSFVSAQSVSDHIEIGEEINEISPIGIWFIEDDQLP